MKLIKIKCEDTKRIKGGVQKLDKQLGVQVKERVQMNQTFPINWNQETPNLIPNLNVNGFSQFHIFKKLLVK